MERLPFCGRKLQSNTGRCSSFSPGAPSMVPVESMWLTMHLHLLRAVAQLDQRLRHGVVHDLDHAAAHQLLVLHQRQIGLDAGGVAIHHEPDGARRSDHRGLRIAEAGPLAQLIGVFPDLLRRLVQIARERAGCPYDSRRCRCIRITSRNGSSFGCIARARTGRFGNARAGQISLAAHHGRDRARPIAALLAVVGNAHRHQQRAQIGKAQAQAAGNRASSCAIFSVG